MRIKGACDCSSSIAAARVAHAPIGPHVRPPWRDTGRSTGEARGQGVMSWAAHVNDARIPTPIPTPADAHAFLACAPKSGAKNAGKTAGKKREGVGIGVGIRGRKSP